MKFKIIIFVLIQVFVTGCSDGVKDLILLKPFLNDKGMTRTSSSSGQDASGASTGEGSSESTNSNNEDTSATTSSSWLLPEKSISEIETLKIQEALGTDSKYKIKDSEIDFLLSEGIVTELEIAELQALK